MEKAEEKRDTEALNKAIKYKVDEAIKRIKRKKFINCEDFSLNIYDPSKQNVSFKITVKHVRYF